MRTAERDRVVVITPSLYRRHTLEAGLPKSQEGVFKLKLEGWLAILIPSQALRGGGENSECLRAAAITFFDRE